MARGKSGRVVIEIEPKLKRALYIALTEDDSTLKEWFIRKAKAYIGSRYGSENSIKPLASDETEK